MRLVGMPPILPRRAKILILGSFPGTASLAAGEYYAHPRNAFWPIILQLLGRQESSYAEQTRLLTRAGIAVWDVLAACERRGSLDSAIVAGTTSRQPNDIAALLAAHPQIAVIATNGRFAAQSLTRYWPNLAETREVLHLPSTSAANARLGAAEKLAAWRQLQPYLPAVHRARGGVMIQSPAVENNRCPSL